MKYAILCTAVLLLSSLAALADGLYAPGLYAPGLVGVDRHGQGVDLEQERQIPYQPYSTVKPYSPSLPTTDSTFPRYGTDPHRSGCDGRSTFGCD